MAPELILLQPSHEIHALSLRAIDFVLLDVTLSSRREGEAPGVREGAKQRLRDGERDTKGDREG